jgi:hypothetical protein
MGHRHGGRGSSKGYEQEETEGTEEGTGGGRKEEVGRGGAESKLALVSGDGGVDREVG